MSASDYISKCLPKVRAGYDNCSGLTMCSLSPTTWDELESIYQDSSGRWRLEGVLLQSDMEGKACQIRQNSLYDFITKNAKNYGTKSLGRQPRGNSGLVDIMPFITVDREGIINNIYWKWTKTVGGTGTAANGAGYDIKGTAESMTSIPAAAAWFPDKTEVFISSKSTAGSHTNTQWLVVYAEVSGTTVVLYLRSRNLASLGSGFKLETPTLGLLMVGVPNVHPAENYCVQPPQLNTTSSYLAWISHTRWSLCNDDIVVQFKKTLRENNQLYRKFFDVPEVKYNKQVLERFQTNFVHTFLFSKPLLNQTATTWSALEQISSWGDNNSGDYLYLSGVEDRCVGRRANVVGVYEQLSECGRVLDLQGQALNWPELQALLYDLYRMRKDNGSPTPEIIEIVVDSAYRIQFIQGLFRYLKLRYEGTLHATFDIRQNDKVSPDLGFVFQDFPLDYPMGVTLRVVSHLAFDDMVAAHKAVSTTLESTGRMALLLDWSSIYMGVIDSMKVENRTGTVNELAKVNIDAFCRMTIPQRSIVHNGLTWVVVVDCPAKSLWLENFSSAVPEHQYKVGVETDAYGNDTTND